MRLSRCGTDSECHDEAFLLCSVGMKEPSGALKIGQGHGLLKVISWGLGFEDWMEKDRGQKTI